jgi:cell wall-associated NlpC family hydrolase
LFFKVGSTHWSYASSCCHGSNTNKCNYFVYDVGREAGAKMPTRSWGRGPIGAGDGGWGKASSLSYWSKVSTPQAGDIVAALNINANAYHVGIYVGTNTAVSANNVDVGKNPKMFSDEYQNLVYWRYQG